MQQKPLYDKFTWFITKTCKNARTTTKQKQKEGKKFKCTSNIFFCIIILPPDPLSCANEYMHYFYLTTTRKKNLKKHIKSTFITIHVWMYCKSNTPTKHNLQTKNKMQSTTNISLTSNCQSHSNNTNTIHTRRIFINCCVKKQSCGSPFFFLW